MAAQVARLATPEGRALLGFSAYMAEHGMDPANLYAALRGARQLGKGLFVAAVQTEGLKSGEWPVGTKACRKYVPPMVPGPREKVAQHLPPGVRSDLVFLEYQPGGRDVLFHLRHHFGLSRPQMKSLKSNKRVALLLLYIHPKEGIQGTHLRQYAKDENCNPQWTEDVDRELSDCLDGLWEEGAALAQSRGLDTEAEAELLEEIVRNNLAMAYQVWFERKALTVAETLPAPSAAAGAASSTQVSAPGQSSEPAPLDPAAAATAKLNAEIAESNLAAHRKKEAAKRGHKKLQPTLTEAHAHATPPSLQPALPDDGKQDEELPRNKSRRPKKAVEKKGPVPSQFELEREMSKLRALAQQHLATAPPLCAAETRPPAPARRRKAPQGDAKLARRVAAADVLA